jgi:glutamine synthetase
MKTNHLVDIQQIMELARRNQIRLVRLLYCDTGGLIRGKALLLEDLPISYRSGIGFPLAQQALTPFDVPAQVEGMGPVGEFRLLPDLSTFVLLPSVRQTACLFGFMHTLDREIWDACPRIFLLRQLARLEEEELSVQVGTEHEFTLARRVEGGSFPYQPADDAPLFAAAALDTHDAFLHPWLTALTAQNLRPHLLHAEYGPGQMEISLGKSTGLSAADHVCVLRETTRALASQHGMVASFVPKPFVEQFAGNGLHWHLSLWGADGNEDEQDNLSYDAQDPAHLSQLGRQFLGGLLAHLPGLVALTCASINSYERLQPQHWCSAYACWGLDNREAAIRVPALSWGQGQESLRMEVRCVDHSANPYLALGTIIAAGLDGIQRQLDPGNPCQVDPALLSQEERERLGIARLPTTLEEALCALERDPVLISALGPVLSTCYLAVKRAEIAYCQERTPQAIALAYFTKY